MLLKSKISIAILAALLVSGCASWQVSVKRVGDATYEALRAASNTADALVVAGKMTQQQRQQFAKEVMVPSLTALDAAITATLQWQEGEPIPVRVSDLIGTLTKATDLIANQFGKESELYSKLEAAKQAASEFLNKVS